MHTRHPCEIIRRKAQRYNDKRMSKCLEALLSLAPYTEMIKPSCAVVNGRNADAAVEHRRDNDVNANENENASPTR